MKDPFCSRIFTLTTENTMEGGMRSYVMTPFELAPKADCLRAGQRKTDVRYLQESQPGRFPRQKLSILTFRSLCSLLLIPDLPFYLRSIALTRTYVLPCLHCSN